MDHKKDENYVDQVAALLVKRRVAPESNTGHDVAGQIDTAHNLKGIVKGKIVRFPSQPCRNLEVQEAREKVNCKSSETALKLVWGHDKKWFSTANEGKKYPTWICPSGVHLTVSIHTLNEPLRFPILVTCGAIYKWPNFPTSLVLYSLKHHN